MHVLTGESKPEFLKQLFDGEIENIGTINTVLNFSDAINNKIHNKLKAIEMALKKIAANHINFSITNRSPNDSLLTDIETVLKKHKPSLMILFTVLRSFPARSRPWWP